MRKQVLSFYFLTIQKKKKEEVEEGGCWIGPGKSFFFLEQKNLKINMKCGHYFRNENIKLEEIANVEAFGFGSGPPPPDILAALVEWLWTVIQNEQKWSKIFKTELQMRYFIEIIYRTFGLPLTMNSTILRILRSIELFFLVCVFFFFFLSDEPKSKYQEYCREVFERMEVMLELGVTNPTQLQTKLQLSAFVIYLYRIAAGQPYVDWESQTWEVLIRCQLSPVLKIVQSHTKDKDTLSQLVYPLLHVCVLFLYFIHHLLLCGEFCKRGGYISFVVVVHMEETILNKRGVHNLVIICQRTKKKKKENYNNIFYGMYIKKKEMVRTLTVEMLRVHIETTLDEEDGDDSGNSSRPKAQIYRQSNRTDNSEVPALFLDRAYADFDKQPFEIDDRCKEINVDVFDFKKTKKDFEQVFMIWDRVIHLFGDPSKNTDDVSRSLHLEGFTDATKLLIIALYSVPMSKARRVKENLKRLKQTTGIGSSTSLLSSASSSERSLPGSTTDLLISEKREYGFSFSTIPIHIDINDLEHVNPAIFDVLPLPPRHLLPQGNTLARLFAPFLFNCCFDLLKKEGLEQQLRQDEFDTAFQCLANIFFTPSEVAFESEILAQFYNLVLKSLQGPSLSIRNIVIRECAKGCLFGKNLPGSHVLLSPFVDLIDNCCNAEDKPKNNKTDMESNATEDITDLLTIASSLISSATHFSTCKIVNSQTKAKASGASAWKFTDLKQIFLQAYKNASEKQLEAKPDFANLVISGLTLIIFDELASTRDAKVLKTALRCIVSCTNPKKLSYGMYAARALDGLSTVCGQLVEIDQDLVVDTMFPNLVNHTMEFLKLTMAATVSRSRTVCQVASDLIFCLLSWIFNFPPSLLQNGNLIGGVLEVLTYALQNLHSVPEGKKLHELPQTQQLVVHAKTAILSLFNYLNNYPLKHDVGAISSNAPDVKSPQGLYLVNGNHSIVNVCDGYVSHERGPERGVRMVVRDDSGKYCWKFTPCSIRARLSHKLGQSKDNANNNNNNNNNGGKKPLSNDGNVETQKKKTPIGIEESKSEIVSRVSVHLDDSDTHDERREDIRFQIEHIHQSTLERLQSLRFNSTHTHTYFLFLLVILIIAFNSFSTATPHLAQYLKDKPAFDYDLGSQTDGLMQVLQYIGGKLHEPDKSDTARTNQTEHPLSSTPTTTDGQNDDHRDTTIEIPDHVALEKSSNSSDASKHKRYSRFGALPAGTLTEQERSKLFSQLSAHETEEKQLNDKSKATRDRQSKNAHSSDPNVNKTGEIMDSQTTPTNSASNSPVLTGDSLSHEEHATSLHSAQKMNELDLDPYPQEAITCLNQFDCSRFLFSHLGLLTPGQAIGVGDFTFSFLETRKQTGQMVASDRNDAALTRHTIKTVSRKEIQQIRQNVPRTRSDVGAPNTSLLFEWERVLGKVDLEKYQSQLNEETLGVIATQEGETLNKRLDLMDRAQSTTREFHKIGVEFVGRDQDQQRLILGNNEGSYCYEKFIDDLGWLADLTVHEGFVGGLAVSSTGRFACYYATGTYEMIFHVATRMPPREGDLQHTERKRHVGNDHVNIVWTEHTRPYLPDTISTDFNTVNIVIYPLQNGLFRIQIHKKDNVGNFGPLINNMVVRQHVLTPLVRLTALEANRTVQLSH
ncbi:hypothetical protein RFI_32913 [Reticulomyxa filosa]|uniref:Rap-GAP domain-containing protein n=1 Tax=Reticulomyxa filosa TaxID=46433 RepID=X6LSZ3_RETFI|nr:hypothetical protein RFI_32913 [Reticulomyxa filosa]|eukprot:ETO04486.1 hypothetical protein RFI_32913 [Reticulomyxa filosa]